MTMNHSIFNPCKLLNRLLASVLLQVLLLLLAFLGFISTAQAAPFFQAAGTAVITGTTDLPVAWPAHAIDDVALLFVEHKGGTTLSFTNAAGFTLIATQTSGNKTALSVYWARASSTAMTSPIIAAPTDHAYAVILTYRGVAGSGLPYDVAGGSANSSSSTTVTLSSVTTTVPSTLIVQAVSRDNNSTSPYFSNEVNASLTGIAERFDAGNAASNGKGGGMGIWDGVFATTGAIANTTATVTSSVNSWETIALKPTVTTLATGTDPAAATIAPGAAATDVNHFTLQTGGGTEVISTVTVNLSTNVGVGRLAITNNAGTELGFVAAPVIGSNTITVTGMSASTTLTNFKVRVTPLSHAAMPAVPGASYAITAPVTAWAGTNAHVGSDTSPILTIDNLSPASATATSGTASSTRVTLNWTTSVATDFSQSVMLRWTAASAGTEVPVEGFTTYANGNTIGTATVVCVRTADAASTAVSGADGAGTGGCSSTALTNGTTYTYKIFQLDSRGNYDAGVLVGPFTPNVTTTLATGSDPVATTIAPGTAATDVDYFTFQTNGSTETVTSITVNLSTNAGVGRLSITDNAGAELGFTTSPVTGSNVITVSGLTATTTLTNYKVRVTPLSHALMPALPGASYAITAPVTVWGGTAIHTGTDTNTVALTIDNLSPTNATAITATASSTQVAFSWTTSAAADFSQSVMLRWTAASAGTEVPVEGFTTYANGNTIGTATVVCVRTADAASTAVSGADGAGTGGCSSTALTNGTTYTYKIFQLDSRGNYDAGVLVGSFTPGFTTTLATGTDPAAATIAPGAAATVIDGFTFITNNNGTESISSVTVNLSNASGVDKIEILNSAGTVLGVTFTPVTGDNAIAVLGMSATTTIANFRIRITPKSHALMPAVPGASYAVTANVTTWVGTATTHTGTDTSNVLTIDNKSPANATAFTIVPAGTQATLNWKTSSATDFNRSVMLRWTGTTAGTEVPVEGVTTYANGNTIGTATVVCVRSDAASTSVSGVDGAGTGGCSATPLVNGLTYTYKIFQQDANGNYDAGILEGAVTIVTTTLDTGTDPADGVIIGPGAAATDVDGFTLITTSGTETITSVTVNLSSISGVGRLAITDAAGAELGFTTSPVVGLNTITVTGMSASTTLTDFKIRITPLSHAAMPAVPGASYAITATVDSWAGPNVHDGSDVAPNALTIDNESPASATATSGTASSTQVTLNWTTSVATDFSQSVMLRWLGGTAGTEVPVEGFITYANGNAIGTATVACVRTDAAGTAVSGADGAGTGGCSSTALTNGQIYTYKIFQLDSRGNYDAGVLVGSFTPGFTTTLATGTDPAAATIAPGAAATVIDGFTFITNNNGTESISSVTVNLSNASGVDKIEILNSAGTVLGVTFTPVTGDNAIAVLGMSATTTLANFRIRITPKSHALMPAVPGASYAVTANVTTWVGNATTHTGTDTSNVLTIDNLSPTSATAFTGTAGGTQTTLNWTTSAATDFSQSVMLRWLGTTAGTEVPVEGFTTYANGNTIGSVGTGATVVCVRTDAASTSVSGVDGTGTGNCSATPLVNGQTYTYKIFQLDARGNYDAGQLVGTFATIVTTTLGTGTDPAAGVTIAPGAVATDVDGFTLITTSGTETITSVTVNLSSISGVGLVDITDSLGSVLGSIVPTATGNTTITVTGMSASTTLTDFKIRITPLSHALMPVVPGASYAITATVDSWAGPNAHAGSDTDPNALTIDNESPASATATSGTAASTQVTLNWTTSAAADFSRSVVLRWLGTAAGSDVPVEGFTTYANGNTIGAATVACVRTDAASTAVSGVDGAGTGGCSATALTNNQTYTYKVFQQDSRGNYDAGVTIGSFKPVPAVTSFNAFETSTAALAIDGRIFTKLAGTVFSLDVVAIAAGSQSVSFSGDVQVELLANTGTVGSGYGTDNCPASNTVIQTIAATTIASGRSTVNFTVVANAYRDVRVRVSYGTVITCSTDSFAIRPVVFAITSTNATNTGTAGTPIFKTGANFNLTASTGAGYVGTPKIDTAQVVGSPTTGVLAGVFGAATSNVTTGDAFTYSEVGNFGLNANAVYDDGFTSIDQTTDCTDDFSTTQVSGKYGCKIGSTAVAQAVGVSGFGRFIPDHFAISSASLTPFCSSGTGFTYFGQDGFTTAFTLTAQNAANATTKNYKGAYAKLDLAAYASYGFTAATLPAGSSLASSATTPSGTWVDGVANVTAKHQISRPTVPTAPTAITVSAAPTDGEVPAAPTATAVGGATNFRYGRLKLSNAYGSSLLDLPVPLEAQYWTASYYATNTLDSCTVIPVSSIKMSNYLGQLNACETKLSPTGSVILTAGKLSGLILTKPGATNGGSVDLAINVSATATGNTCVGATQSAATAANMPWFGSNLGARASFGVYKSPLIYRRENY